MKQNINFNFTLKWCNYEWVKILIKLLLSWQNTEQCLTQHLSCGPCNLLVVALKILNSSTMIPRLNKLTDLNWFSTCDLLSVNSAYLEFGYN